MAISSPSTLLFAELPFLSTAFAPCMAGRASRHLMVCSMQKGRHSMGRGKCGPILSTILDWSTMTMNLSAAASTIFSLKRAPPPPFTRFRLESTESAPSMATSRQECVSRVTSGMFRDSACSLVRMDVGMARMSVSSPEAS